MTQKEIQTQIETADQEVTKLREQRSTLPKNDTSFEARQLDSAIEKGLGRIADLNDVCAPIQKLDELIETLIAADQITNDGTRDDVDRQTWTRLNDLRELITTGEVA